MQLESFVVHCMLMLVVHSALHAIMRHSKDHLRSVCICNQLATGVIVQVQLAVGGAVHCIAGDSLLAALYTSGNAAAVVFAPCWVSTGSTAA